MTIKTEMQSVFETLHSSLTEIEYKNEFANGTGYFDGALDFQFPIGVHAVAFTAAGEDKRRGVICKIQGGVICLFERYTPGSGSHFVMVANATDHLRKHWPHGQWSTEAVRCLKMVVELT